MRPALAALFLLTACAGHENPLDDPEVRLDGSRIMCRPGPDCNVKWTRALDWVRTHSHWRVRTTSDELIQTEGPGYTLYPAFTVRRMPVADGAFAIVFEAGCSPAKEAVVVPHMKKHGPRWEALSGSEPRHTDCLPSELELRASFVEFVNASAPR